MGAPPVRVHVRVVCMRSKKLTNRNMNLSYEGGGGGKGVSSLSSTHANTAAAWYLQYPLVSVTLLYRKQATRVDPPTRVASSCNMVLVPSMREGACSNYGRRGAAQTTGPVQQ